MRANANTIPVTWNGGEEYLHAIAAQTYPFESTETSLIDQSRSDSSRATDEPVHFAAPCAKDACEYLKIVAPLVVSNDKAHETQFNEILSVAYSQSSPSDHRRNFV